VRRAELIALYSTISRMRARSSPRVVGCADEITRVIFAAPNKTVSQCDELVKSEAGLGPLKNFSEVAREELQISALWPIWSPKSDRSVL
jgi:hypothetical protein